MALVPTVEEARSAFELAEAEPDPGEKLSALEEALALIDELLEEPGISDRQHLVAENIRKTYLRRLLQQLLAQGSIQFSEWFSYARLLLVDQKGPIAEILEADDALKEALETFIALWEDKFKEALGEDIRTFVSK